MAKHNLVGHRFGKLVVVEKLPLNRHRETEWLCKCDCGNTHKSTSYNLTRGRTTQCRQCMINQIASANTKHQCSPKRLHEIWVNMKTRCHNPNYPLYHRYGGRGIKICDAWEHSFANFKEWALTNGYSSNLTIDRIDNDGDYCPENCKWSTVTEQSNNRVTNRILVLNGERDTMANWSRRTGIPYWVIQHRLYDLKWSDEETLSTPYRRAR